MTELVMFDRDGVLVDSEGIAVRVRATPGAESGRPLTEDEVVDPFAERSHTAVREQVAARLGADVPTPVKTYSGPRSTVGT